MAFQKGHPKIGGRKAGTPNQTTQLLKDAIIQAATNAGEGDMIEYLTVQAKQNPGPFMSLLGKVLPMQLTGGDGKDLVINLTIGGDDPANAS